MGHDIIRALKVPPVRPPVLQDRTSDSRAFCRFPRSSQACPRPRLGDLGSNRHTVDHRAPEGQDEKEILRGTGYFWGPYMPRIPTMATVLPKSPHLTHHHTLPYSLVAHKVQICNYRLFPVLPGGPPCRLDWTSPPRHTPAAPTEHTQS